MTTQTAPLPELSAERVDEMEDALFARIGRERSSASARRGRWWLAGGAAAAIVVVAAIAAPTIGGLVRPGPGGATSAGSAADAPAPANPPVADAAAGAEASLTAAGTGDRVMITSATAAVVVDDPAVAARAVGDAATAVGGYVESMSLGAAGGAVAPDPAAGNAYDTVPYPPAVGSWISVRVPASALDGVVAGLSELGDVVSSSTNRQDVTDQRIDLQARVDATRASVQRLTDLMAQAGSVGDLITAETALADRQALLESYEQQLKSLDGQVEMSTLSVELRAAPAAVAADPAGFSDGLTAGWNGLVATMNGTVVALGFLLPWLALAAIVAAVVWGVVRLIRRRPRRTSPEAD